ncbi:MAG TPA: universal stress protein, partial [Blastocatellia bacterium]|nr:universal stress protein [Blastocatellia bacterium]
PRGTGQQGFRLLLATDGSDCSLAAAREVASRPWPAGSEVQVVSAVEILAAAIEPFFPGPRIVTQVQEESASISETAVREAAALLDASGLKTSVKLLKGDSKEQIVRYAREWHADLVVVGTHTRHGLSLLLEGSVSEAVALESECSVLVVREARA